MRGYPPPSNAMLFDDDPGIMSEVETSSTGFRRGGKQRSSLPVVRTPSKTLERPLGKFKLLAKSNSLFAEVNVLENNRAYQQDFGQGLYKKRHFRKLGLEQ